MLKGTNKLKSLKTFRTRLKPQETSTAGTQANLILIDNCEKQSRDFRNDLEARSPLSDEEAELPKIVQVVQGHMAITLVMQY